MYGALKEDNVEVFTICTTADRKEWEDYIRTNNLTQWINGWDPERRTNMPFSTTFRPPRLYTFSTGTRKL
jgi:hypothetical protein